jgi:hypothetical protein
VKSNSGCHGAPTFLPRLRCRAPLVQLTIVKTPCDAVELDVRLRDLADKVDGEKVETLHLVLAACDAGEVPVPHDARAVVHDRERLDADLGMLGDFRHPLGARGCRRCVAQLW